MTVIRPNSISGITSLTAHRGSIDFYAHDGSAATFTNINSNVTSGVSTFASLNITGDLDVGGALTYEDVTNIDSVGVITARAGVKVPDSQTVFLGTDDDLRIFHDGSQNAINSYTSNPFNIISNGDTTIKTNNNESMAVFKKNNAVELYYDNTKKFETTSGGVEVSSGNLTMQSNGRIFVGNGGNATNPMFANVSDTNTGIAFPAADTMLFTTGGSERLRITSDGYLGINHTSPGTRLVVKQNNGVAYNGNAQSVSYNAAAFINANGHTNGGTYTGFQFNITGDSQNRICSMGMITEASNSRASSLVFHTDDGGNRTEKLRIKSDGDVYIGNIAHSNDGGANSSYRTLTLTDTTNGAQLHLRGQSPKLFLDVTSGGNGEIYYDSGDLRILSGEPGNAGSTERLRVTSAGKVLINSTDNSDAQLLVKSADKLHPALKLDGLSANGFSLLGDEYLTDESNFTMGIAYSSASLVTGWGVKVSPTAANEYLSSQDTYSTKHSAVRHDGDGWKFLSNSTSQTVTTDSVVSLTERIRISSDGKILKGMTSSILGSSDVQLTGSGGPAKIAGYWSNNNPGADSNMLSIGGYSQSGSTFTAVGEIDFRVDQNFATSSGSHSGSIVTRVNAGNTSGTWSGQAYSFAGLKDRERLTRRSKRYYCLPEVASGSDTYNTFREEWDYQHIVGYNQYSWYRFTSHSSSSSRGGSVDIRVTWSTRHAAGNGYGHYAFHWRDSHANGYMEIGNVYRYHLNYLGGSYYGWSGSPQLDVYEINDSGNNAGFYLRVQGHISANGNTYDGGVVHQFTISSHTNRYGGDKNKFEFVGNSTPSDVGSIQGLVNLP